MAEFECNSNAVACPRLHPGRASARDRTAPQDRRREEKNIQIRLAQRLELESTFRRTRVCTSRIATRFETRWMESARSHGREKKNIQIFRPSDTSWM